jgi:uncharacterized protein (TIGR00251 family)
MNLSATHFLHPEKSGAVVVDIHVVPNARQTDLDGLHDGALRVRLHAPPVDGKANEALVAWLAQRLDIPRRSVSLIRGLSHRRKQLRIDAAVAQTARWERLLPAQLPDQG